MNLLIRISLTIAALVIVLVIAWKGLPRILESAAHYQLEQLGYSDVHIDVAELGLSSATIRQLSMSGDDVRIAIENLVAIYNLSDLMSGQFASLSADNVAVTMMDTGAGGFSLPEPVVLSTLLSTAWHNLVPAGTVSINTLELRDENGNHIVQASFDVQRKEGGLYGETRLIDDQGISHHLGINISPESGVGIQLLALNEDIENPLSVVLLPDETGKGLGGRIRADLSALPGLRSRVPGLSGTLVAQISYAETSEEATQEFSISAEVRDLVLSGAQVQKSSINIKGTLRQHDDLFNLQLRESSVITLDNIQRENITAQSASVRLPAAVDFKQGEIVLPPNNGASIKLKEVRVEDRQIPEMTFSNISLKASQQAGVKAGCTIRSDLFVPSVIIDDLRLEINSVSLTAICPDDEKPAWVVNGEFEQINAENPDVQVTVEKCSMSLRYPLDESLPLTGKMSCAGNELPGKINTDFRYHLESEKGDANFSFPEIRPNSQSPLIRSIMNDWNEPFDIVSGDLSVSGNYRWWQSSSGKDQEHLAINLTISGTGGFYENILFSGLEYSDRIDLLPVIQSEAFSEVRVKDIDIGIPVTNTTANVLYGKSSMGELPVVTLNDVSLTLMDGQLRGNDINIDLNSDHHEFYLVVDGLNLEEIVAVQQLEGLTATGRIDGFVPVRLTPEGVVIADGKIVSQPQGGVIRYAPDGGTAELEQSAMGSEMLFRIIEDLNYHSLSIDVDYQASGDLDLALAIKGKSPKFDENRPIHFNLNLQQNVIKLLKGLRYADGLREEIDRNVQEYFRNNKNPLN